MGDGRNDINIYKQYMIQSHDLVDEGTSDYKRVQVPKIQNKYSLVSNKKY